ncbi:MAG: DUF1830 domain-containing protein [Symploca sp. SIO2E6]|nr:DUF1830 domain-containing protein [Symploca sp. SIO2E6]
MSELLNSYPGNSPASFPCYYANQSSSIQIIRITNIPNFYFERVVFPGQRMIFETVENARLEVHSSNSITTIITDVIPCQQISCDNGATLAPVPSLSMVW